MLSNLDEAQEMTFEFETHEGRLVTGRVTGRWIAERVILAEGERIIVVDEQRNQYWKVEGDPEEELRKMLDVDEYAEPMAALGIEPVVDI